jgi:hypothetical protein
MSATSTTPISIEGLLQEVTLFLQTMQQKSGV